MKISNLSADVIHEGDEVILNFRIPAKDFLLFIERLKKAKVPKLRVSAGIDPAERLAKVKEILLTKVKEYQLKNPVKYPSKMYVEFMNHWTHMHKDGKRIRYDTVDFFEVGKRLATFRKYVKQDEWNAWWLKDKEKSNSNELFN